MPTFAESIAKSDAVLKPHGFDLYNVITSKDKSVVEDVVNAFAGIAAIQARKYLPTYRFRRTDQGFEIQLTFPCRSLS